MSFFNRKKKESPVDDIKWLRSDIKWFHSIKTADGSITPGDKPHHIIQKEADVIFSGGVEGKSVLDIGAWDGAFSYQAEARGASRVLATDHFCWSGPGWGTKAGFDFLHENLNSKVESKDVDVFGLSPKELGTFDVVLFLGVLYHLEDPYGGLKKAAEMTHDTLVVETHSCCNHIKEPVLRFFLGDELAGDTTNFFSPNELCLERMLRDLGFTDIQISVGFAPDRRIAIAKR